jgi:hypothetical protein
MDQNGFVESHSPSFSVESETSKKRKVEFLNEMMIQPDLTEEDNDTVPISKKILAYDIDPHEFSEEEESILIDYAVEMFRHYNLMNEFHFKETVLRKFFEEVRKLYNNENQFHNFKHVWGVMHLSFQILYRGADQYLKPLDIFAVLIAAICHDIAHPGNNNAFEIITHSELSKMYADPPDEVCILERHHAKLTKGLLTNEYGQALLKGLNKQQKDGLFAQIFQIIMATDMAKHAELVREARCYTVPQVSPTMDAHKSTTINKSVVVTPRTSVRIANIRAALNKHDPESRIRFTRIIVHSADIGAQTQCLKVACKWVNRCYDEFRSQADKEKSLGIVTSPFLHQITLESQKFADQCEFIRGLIEPMWQALTALLPELRFAYEQLIANKVAYGERVHVEDEKEQRIRRMSSLSGDDIQPHLTTEKLPVAVSSEAGVNNVSPSGSGSEMEEES